MTKGHPWKFVIVGDNIEARYKENGEFVHSVACKKCLPELERIIKKFKKEQVK